MIDLTVPPDSRECIASMKGKVLRSYEFSPLAYGSNSAFGHCRINLGRSAYELVCVRQYDIDCSGLDDWPLLLCCAKADDGDGFDALSADLTPRQHCVNEAIVGVSIINDYVHVKYNEAEDVDNVLNLADEIEMSLDIAVVVYTESHTFAFSRGGWSSEIITVNVDLESLTSFTKERHELFWVDNDDDDSCGGTVEIKRTIIPL